MTLHRNIHLQAIYDKTEFVGLDFLVEGKTEVYLGYLAIVPDKRGQGYGSRVLKVLEQNYSAKQLVLDIEPVTRKAENYKQRSSRLHFYQHNGFHRTKKDLVDDGGEYAILTTANKFNPAVFKHLLKWMSFGLYRFKIE
ncbi:GNAT family N-acetyltransferase [Lactobacillus sp. ESL0791]|uniref:GNAT family N-acetyltransferase n=1 Tax=Lactobacillus sp. ESL0791 TaxID=2983234 RepID=UPI0023F74B07|nr:GNAT family N-acetyltransferase [Lactobacillus sp. ESL0791]MDF7639261.1 GNAT family N-acetyltransferase [Lactobacillus sp. ESL0791]